MKVGIAVNSPEKQHVRVVMDRYEKDLSVTGACDQTHVCPQTLEVFASVGICSPMAFPAKHGRLRSFCSRVL